MLRGAYHVASASELIKRQIKSLRSGSVSSEQIRLSATDNMQTLMIQALQTERQTVKAPIILDCHAVIDKGEHLEFVPISVFEEIGVSMVIHLVVNPSVIWFRRRDDHSRVRPEISVDRLKYHQNRSIAHARKISAAIQAEYVETNGSDLYDLLKIKG